MIGGNETYVSLCRRHWREAVGDSPPIGSGRRLTRDQRPRQRDQRHAAHRQRGQRLAPQHQAPEGRGGQDHVFEHRHPAGIGDLVGPDHHAHPQQRPRRLHEGPEQEGARRPDRPALHEPVRPLAAPPAATASAAAIPTSPITPSMPKNPASSVSALSSAHHSRVAMLPIAYSAPADTGSSAASEAPAIASGPSTRITPDKARPPPPEPAPAQSAGHRQSAGSAARRSVP